MLSDYEHLQMGKSAVSRAECEALYLMIFVEKKLSLENIVTTFGSLLKKESTKFGQSINLSNVIAVQLVQ